MPPSEMKFNLQKVRSNKVAFPLVLKKFSFLITSLSQRPGYNFLVTGDNIKENPNVDVTSLSFKRMGLSNSIVYSS